MIDYKKELEPYKLFVDEFGEQITFNALVMSLYMDEPLTKEFIIDNVTEDNDDKKTDFLAITKDEDSVKRIYLAQSTLSDKPNKQGAKANKAADLNTAISWFFSGNRALMPMKLKNRADDCKESLGNNEVTEFHVLYTHNMPETINVTNELKTIEDDLVNRLKSSNITIIVKEVGENTFNKLVNFKRDGIKITDEISFPFEFQHFQETEDWNAEVSVITGTWLYDQYQKYGEDLFSGNYRGFLGASARKKINNKIKSTAENNPHDFWAYNNGITILTNSIEKKSKKINGISIINGAQTTGCIGNISNKNSLIDIKVLCKVVSCKNSEKSNDIIKYTNTQNAITTWDKYSNDPTQKIIEEQLKKYSLKYSVKRGAEVNNYDMGIETVAQPLLAFRGDFFGAYDGKNNIFNKKELYDNAFNKASGRHLILVNSISLSYDNFKATFKRTLNEDSPEKKHQMYNLLSEIGFKSFYLYMFGKLISDIFDKNCDVKSVALDNNSLENNELIEIYSLFTDITEKLANCISLTFYKNNNSLRFREVIRKVELFSNWIDDIDTNFSIALSNVSRLQELRDVLAKS